MRYLRAWLQATPDDPFVRGELDALTGVPAKTQAAARAVAFVEAGISFHRAGRSVQAVRCFRQAVSADPESVSAWLSLGALLNRAGRHAEALACYDRILALAPPSGDVLADTLTARSHELIALGRPAEALRDRRAALATGSPSWPWRKQVASFIEQAGVAR